MKTYYCETCGEWFRAESQIEIAHHHSGIEDNFMLCKPVGLKAGQGYVGIKPIYRRQYSLIWKWRAMVIYIEQGYSETPSWGNEAGGWIHYTYEAMRDPDGVYIEAPTESSLIEKLKAVYEEDNYFKYVEVVG